MGVGFRVHRCEIIVADIAGDATNYCTGLDVLLIAPFDVLLRLIPRRHIGCKLSGIDKDLC